MGFIFNLKKNIMPISTTANLFIKKDITRFVTPVEDTNNLNISVIFDCCAPENACRQLFPPGYYF